MLPPDRSGHVISFATLPASAFPGAPETALHGLPVPSPPRQGQARPVSRIFCGYPLALREGATIMPR